MEVASLGLTASAALTAGFFAHLSRKGQEEKQRTENSLLALSNLNLAASGLQGGEMQMMLSQVLESVLSMVRMSAGAFFLHHGDCHGPTSFVSVGLTEPFCRALHEEGL